MTSAIPYSAFSICGPESGLTSPAVFATNRTRTPGTQRSTSYGPIASSAVIRSYRNMTTSVARPAFAGTCAARRVPVATVLTAATRQMLSSENLDES